MKKLFSLIAVLLVILITITGCSKNQVSDDDDVFETPTEPKIEDSNNDVTGSITEVETIDQDLNQDEVDTELNDLEQDLLNW
ncbi:hypothetical protein HN789_05285 [archaeon]|jgi:peptidoglycan hydrolase CwlO-like protein|nr:hypothetical protein [archaeon]MBT3721635.1 hypothetical protein [archaeon]MBT4022925.1 hypothetical protein [archaeon]MBT4271916.1 hypothetical protein [archaeon]MBT4461754.1 hypothetical protein [archaeon]